MRNLYLIRHGQTDTSLPPCMDREFGLTELGKQQAHALGKRLKSAGVNATQMYCSVLLRARQTAGIVREYLDAPLAEREDLIEHGSQPFLLDCSISEVARRHPDRLKSDGEVRCVQGEGPGLNWNFSVAGESVRALHARARGAYEAILARHSDDASTILVIAHGSFLSAFLTEVFGLPLRPVWNFNFANAGAVRVRYQRSDDDRMLPVFAADGPGGEFPPEKKG